MEIRVHDKVSADLFRQRDVGFFLACSKYSTKRRHFVISPKIVARCICKIVKISHELFRILGIYEKNLSLAVNCRQKFGKHFKSTLKLGKTIDAWSSFL